MLSENSPFIPMKKTLILLVFVALSITKAFSQQFNQSGSFLISVNPLKLFYGIINAEFEYQVTSSVSIQLSSEYVLFHYIVKKENHPDFVIRIGPRYHSFNNKDFGDRNDLYFGAFSGYTWSKDNNQMRSFNFGTEAGYKHKFEKPAYINSKIILTSPFYRPKIIPGFECLIGYIK